MINREVKVAVKKTIKKEKKTKKIKKIKKMTRKKTKKIKNLLMKTKVGSWRNLVLYLI